MISQTTSYPHWTQVYGEGAGEYPRAWKCKDPDVVFVCMDELASSTSVVFDLDDGRLMHSHGWDDVFCQSNSRCTLLTGPEAAEYVAAAREGRDAVWPPKAKAPAPLPTPEEVATEITTGLHFAIAEAIREDRRLRDQQHAGRGK